MAFESFQVQRLSLLFKVSLCIVECDGAVYLVYLYSYIKSLRDFC